MIKLALVDDHKIFLGSLNSHLSTVDEFEVVFAAASAEELFQKLASYPTPDVLLLDIKMSGQSGLKCLERIRIDWPSIHVIMLSMFTETSFVHQAFQNGARGFIPKGAEPEELRKAINVASRGDYYLYDGMSKHIIRTLEYKQEKSANISLDTTLTTNQFEVLLYICQGMTNDEIGKKLFKSKRTIEGYRQRLLDNTGSKNTAALIAWAFREGVVE